MLDFLDEFKKSLQKIEGVSTDASPPRYWFGSGNYVLNKITSGDYTKCIPQGRITAFAGPSGAGKSFLLGNVIKQAQQEGVFVFIIDSENALDDDFMHAIGVDTISNYSYIGVSTIPQVVKAVSAFIKGYREEYQTDENAPKILIAVDSLDMLMTETELNNYERGEPTADQGQHPKQLKQMLRTLSNGIKGLNISVIVTKQVYRASAEQLMRGEGAYVLNDAIRYSASQIILLTKLKLKDNVGSKEITGIRMKAEAFKTRHTKPFQVVTIEVPYSTGMNPLSGLLEVAVAEGIVDNSTKGWYKLVGSDQKWRESQFHTYADDILVKLCAKKNTYLKIIDEKTHE